MSGRALLIQASSEIKILGSALMKSPFAPESGSNGENVKTIARVDAMTEGATSLTPLYTPSICHPRGQAPFDIIVYDNRVIDQLFQGR